MPTDTAVAPADPATEPDAPVVEDPPADVDPPDVPAADDTAAAAVDDAAPPTIDAPDLELAEPEQRDGDPAAVDPVSGLTIAQINALAILRASTQEWEKGYKPTVWCKKCTEARKQFRLACEDHNVVNDCPRCHNKITSAHVDLSYMGHAAVTNRLLMADPAWTWTPMQRDLDVSPLVAAVQTGNADILDRVIAAIVDKAPPRIVNGGMWITLTVAGMTRMGFGDAQGKDGPNAVKEVIGDAIRNAAMRFGCGLDLWHKGEFQDDAVITHVAPVADGGSRQAADTAHAAAESPQAAPGSGDTGKPASGQQRASQAGGPGGSAHDPQVILDTLAGVRSRVAWVALRKAAEEAPGGLDVKVEWQGAAMSMGEAFENRAKELAAKGVS